MARPPKITEESIAFAELAYSRRLHKHAIKALLRQQFALSARSCERVLARARERILERTGKPKDEHRMDSLMFYDSIIRDSAAQIRYKILAQERIDKLLGLEAPAKQNLTIAPPEDEKKIEATLEPLGKDALRRIIAITEELPKGGPEEASRN